MTHNSASDLVQIGRFMQLTQLSRKALRLYEQRDILHPMWIDPETGYRFYSEDQVATARLIRLLRGMEMPLATIRQLITAEEDAAVDIVRQFQREQAQRAEQLKTTAQLACRLLTKETTQMSIEISIKSVPAQTMVCHTAKVKIADFPEFIQKTLGMLYHHVDSAGAQIAGDPIAMYHGPVNEDSDGPVEICWPYSGELQPTTGITLRHMPAHQLAYHHAPLEKSRFPEIIDVWNAVIDYAQQNKLETFPEGLTCYEQWPQDTSVLVGWPFVE